VGVTPPLPEPDAGERRRAGTHASRGDARGVRRDVALARTGHPPGDLVKNHLAGITTAALAVAGFATVVPATTVAAAPSPATGRQAKADTQHSDELLGTAEQKRRALRQTALTDVLQGKKHTEKRGGSTVVKLGTKLSAKTRNGKSAHKVDQYAELAREKTDKIFTVLVDFGNDRDPKYPDQDTDPATPGPTRFDGPLHNQIPKVLSQSGTSMKVKISKK
jgi:immune inhibitor A